MNRLKELRKEKKDTQAELANLMGVNVKTISRWEKGEFEIKPAQAKMLADYFGVSVGYLLGYSNKEERSSSIELKNDIRRELMDSYPTNAKAKLLDIIIEEGYILQSTIDKCISKLNETDQQEIRKVL